MNSENESEKRDPQERENANRPVMQPKGEHKGEAPTGEKGAQDIAQGADPDN